jgi:hypothetical protein
MSGNIGVLFPGGLALLDNDHTERKLGDLLSEETTARVWRSGGRWQVEIFCRFGTYNASSALSMLDAFANAMQAATGREET